MAEAERLNCDTSVIQYETQWPSESKCMRVPIDYRFQCQNHSSADQPCNYSWTPREVFDKQRKPLIGNEFTPNDIALCKMCGNKTCVSITANVQNPSMRKDVDSSRHFPVDSQINCATPDCECIQSFNVLFMPYGANLQGQWKLHDNKWFRESVRSYSATK